MNIDHLKWGLELEFARPAHATAGGTINLEYSGINVAAKHDSSPRLATGFERYSGVEFITTKLWSTFPEKDVRVILEFANRHGYRVTPTCGMHFHFSGITLRRSQFDRLGEILSATNFWKSRAQWCALEKIGKKHSALKFVAPGHYEARVFNGTNSYQGVIRPWLFLVESIKKVTE